MSHSHPEGPLRDGKETSEERQGDVTLGPHHCQLGPHAPHASLMAGDEEAASMDFRVVASLDRKCSCPRFTRCLIHAPVRLAAS
jgi:hypothetical protein